MGFDDLQGFARRYQERLLLVFQRSCLSLSVIIIRRTPVDTGVLRASWTPAINRLDNTNVGGDLISACASLKLGDKYTLVNGQPYVRVIEYEGRSQQAPNGMRRVSTAQWPMIVQAEVDRLVR